MSPSSTRRRAGGRPRVDPSDDRGQVEPTAALSAVFAVTVGLSLYAGVAADVSPTVDRDVAGPTLSRVHDALDVAGVVDPDRLPTAHDAGPRGYRLNVTLRVDGERWSAGPTPPGGIAGDGRQSAGSVGSAGAVETAGRRVGVRTGNRAAGTGGTVEPGRLRVAVWR